MMDVLAAYLWALAVILGTGVAALTIGALVIYLSWRRTVRDVSAHLWDDDE